MQPLRGLIPNEESVRVEAEEVLEAMTAYGDILEHDRIAGHGADVERRLLYAAPPSFVRRQSGAVLLVGIAPGHNSPLPEELETKIEYVNHVRKIEPIPDEDLSETLQDLGFVELALDQWTQKPSSESSGEHLSRLNSRLDAAPTAGEIPGLRLISSTSSPRYYRGRWITKLDSDGRFVGRRPQAYGADLWCFVEICDGRPHRLLDLPLDPIETRGCDEAWRLQAAIDSVNETPQQVRIRPGPEGSTIMDFFSPIPRWAERRWISIGDPASPNKCLLSHRFSDTEFQEELRFAEQELWLASSENANGGES